MNSSLLPRGLALPLDPRGLGTIVHERFAEPGMPERFFGRDAVHWIIYEYAFEKIQELDVECVGRGDNVLRD